MKTLKRNLSIISIIFLVGIVVAVSGCVGQRQVTVLENDGLRINSFTADPPSVDVGESVIFTGEAENVGGVDATNVQVSLNGIENTWRTSSGNLIPDANTYKKTFLKMSAPNPQYNQPGDLKIAAWTFKTPEQPAGYVSNKDVSIVVLYDYKTTGTITFKAVGYSYLKTNYIAKGKTVDTPKVFNTNSPVKILWPETENWPTYYIRVDDTSEAEAQQESPVQIRLVNIGSGFPITDGIPGAIYGNISLRGPAKFRECLGQTETNNVVITPQTLGADLAKLKLHNGESKITCTIYIDKAIFMQRGIPEEPITLNFDLDFRYYLTKPVSVSVSSYK